MSQVRKPMIPDVMYERIPYLPLAFTTWRLQVVRVDHASHGRIRRIWHLLHAGLCMAVFKGLCTYGSSALGE